MSKKTPTVNEFLWPGSLTEALMPRQSGETCSPSMDNPGEVLSIWLSQVSRVNRGALLEDGTDRMMTAGSGRRSPVWFARWDPATSSWRTCLASLFTQEWDQFSETWPRSGSMRNGVCRVQPTWARPTSASGCSFSRWPTPDTMHHLPGTAVRPPMEGRQAGTRHKMALHHAVEALWPTPNVPNGGRTLSPEDVAAKGRSAKGKRQVGLENVASLWPTPASAD